METKHTPGPWGNEEGTWADINSPEGDVCIVLYEGNVGEKFIIQDGVRMSKATAKANARLISAAPELLAAALRVQAFMDDYVREGYESAMRRELRAAIAKATQP